MKFENNWNEIIKYTESSEEIFNKIFKIYNDYCSQIIPLEAAGDKLVKLLKNTGFKGVFEKEWFINNLFQLWG